MTSFFNLTSSNNYFNSWTNLIIESFSIEHYNKIDDQHIILNSGANKVKMRFKIYCGFGAVGKRKTIKSVIFANTEYICNCSPSSTSTRWVYGDVEFNIKVDSSSFGVVGPTFKDGTDTIVASTNWTDFSYNLYLLGEQYIDQVKNNFSLDENGHNLQGIVEVIPPRKISDFLLRVTKNNIDYDFHLNAETNNNNIYNINFDEFNSSNLFQWTNMQLYYRSSNMNDYKLGNYNIDLTQRLRLLEDYNIIFNGKVRFSSNPPEEWLGLINQNKIPMPNSSFDILTQDGLDYKFNNCTIENYSDPFEEPKKICLFNFSDEPKLLIKNINEKNYEFSLLPLMDYTSYFPPLYYLGSNLNYLIYENFQIDLTDENNPKLTGTLPLISFNNCSNPESVKLSLVICGDLIQKQYYEINCNLTATTFILPKLQDAKVYKIYLKAADEEQTQILTDYYFCEYSYMDPICEIEKELTSFNKITNQLTFFIKKDGNLRYKDDNMHIIKNFYTGDLNDGWQDVLNYKNKYYLQVNYNNGTYDEFVFNSGDFIDETFYSVTLSNINNKKIETCELGYYNTNNSGETWFFNLIQEIYSTLETPTVVYMPNQLGINCIPGSTDILKIKKMPEQNSPYKIVIGDGIIVEGTVSGGTWDVLT